MTPDQIKMELFKRRKKINMAKIGRNLDPPVTQPAVQRVVEGSSISERIMIAIADAIAIPPEQVFPNHKFEN